MEEDTVEVEENRNERLGYSQFRKVIAKSRAIGSFSLQQLKDRMKELGWDKQYPDYCQRLIEDYPEKRSDYYKKNVSHSKLYETPGLYKEEPFWSWKYFGVSLVFGAVTSGTIYLLSKVTLVLIQLL